MLLSVCFVFLASIFLPSNTLDLASPAIVDTGYAKYLGNRTFPNTVAYLGIPYAEPPVGERRWRAPLPLNKARISQDAKGAVVDATKYPDFCVQGKTGGNDVGGAGSEDCLKVNIYTPASAKKGSNLPVLVYIHGGGYIFGNPANWPFNHWIHQSPNVVIVSVYYRLSSFGFLSTPEFSDPAVGDHNVGFRDQIEALKWVKQNVASFGGNPAKVTINGESAGGSSVELHLVANENEKLFSGAIAQSVYRVPLPTPEQQKPLFQFYSQFAGCGSGPIESQMACLRKASIGDLARAQDAGNTPVFNASKYNNFRPVLDGKLLSEAPTASITSGKFQRVPLIVGATTNETLARGPTVADALTTYCPQLSVKEVDELLTLYPSADFISDDLKTQTITGDVSLRCARTIMASKFSEKTTAWTYRYNQPNPTSGGSAIGHAAENWMMFLGTNTGVNGSTTFTPMTPAETSFAEELIAYWLSFVRAGNPNTFKLTRSPVWLSYSANRRSRNVLQQDTLNTTTHSGSFIETEVEPETSRCDLISKQVSQQN